MIDTITLVNILIALISFIIGFVLGHINMIRYLEQEGIL